MLASSRTLYAYIEHTNQYDFTKTIAFNSVPAPISVIFNAAVKLRYVAALTEPDDREEDGFPFAGNRDKESPFHVFASRNGHETARR